MYIVNFNSLNIDEWDSSEKFNTKEDAVKYAKQQLKSGEEKSKIIQVGEYEVYKPYVDVDTLIEQLKDDAYDEAGDAGEYYLDLVSEEDIQALEEIMNDAFSKWLKLTENDNHDFGTIENIENIDLKDNEI